MPKTNSIPPIHGERMTTSFAGTPLLGSCEPTRPKLRDRYRDAQLQSVAIPSPNRTAAKKRIVHIDR